MAFSLPLALSKYFLLAQITVCPLQDQIPIVEVEFKPGKPVYITEAPSRDLTKVMKGNRDATHMNEANSRWRTIGMTEASIGGGNYNAAYSQMSDSAGNTCIYVSQLTFSILYNPNIYIANEVMGLPCVLRVTKLHEQRHVAADLNLIRKYIPKLKMELMWYLRGLGPQGPFPAASAEAERHRILKNAVEAVKPMVERLAEERRRRQGDIDTLENYRYENSFCPGERPELK